VNVNRPSERKADDTHRTANYYHPFDKSKTNENKMMSTYPGGTVSLPTRLWLLPYLQRQTSI